MKNLIFITLTFTSTLTFAQNKMNFTAVWNQVQSNSAALSASEAAVASKKEANSNAKLHWLPTVYLDAKTYRTNDPGNSFFGLLEQKSLQQSDFSTTSINNPGSNQFTRSALGVDFPLYEGGLKSNKTELTNNLLQAQTYEDSQLKIDQYAMTGMLYSSINSLEDQLSKINDLQNRLTALSKNYRLANKANPVGYSGSLGMKALENRILGLKNYFQTQISNSYKMLTAMGLKETNWQPEKKSATDFINIYFSEANANTDSYAIKASQEKAKASSYVAEMENARYLPRVAAFAETYNFAGSRDNANGYTAGLYLQWALFDSGSYGKKAEAKAMAIAADKSSQALQEKNTQEFASLKQQKEMLANNLQILKQSQDLLSEQTQLTENLFKNGSVNVLQFIEVLNRRVDLVQQYTETELNYLKVSTELVTKTNYSLNK